MQWVDFVLPTMIHPLTRLCHWTIYDMSCPTTWNCPSALTPRTPFFFLPLNLIEQRICGSTNNSRSFYLEGLSFTFYKNFIWIHFKAIVITLFHREGEPLLGLHLLDFIFSIVTLIIKIILQKKNNLYLKVEEIQVYFIFLLQEILHAMKTCKLTRQFDSDKSNGKV